MSTSTTPATAPSAVLDKNFADNSTVNTESTESTSNKNADNNSAPFIQHLIQPHGFQSLYLEYYTFLYDLDVAEIVKYYQLGLQHNLKKAHFNSEVLRYVQTDITNVAKQIEEQKIQCKDTILAHVSHESAMLQQALCEILKSNTEDKQALKELIEKHVAQLNLHDEDILTQFNLAWIYFHLKEDFNSAKRHLTQVVDKSILMDSPLPQLALRYLAMSEYLSGETTDATASLKRSASLDQTDKLHYLYEIAQILIDTDKNDVAISHLKALIKNSPLYYIHIQSDPFFTETTEVDNLLSRFHAAKLEAIKETTYQKWQDSEIMQQTLPKEFDQQALFNETYEEHLTLLNHQPYPILCRTETISDKFLRNLQNKTKTTLNTINQEFIQHIKTEQKKWKVINLMGVGLVYIAVLLTLASIFLFIGGDLLGLTSAETAIDWGKLVPKIFASVLGTGVLGIFLLQFNTPKLKQLAKKKSMLTKAID